MRNCTSNSVKEGFNVVQTKTTSVMRELSCTCFKPKKERQDLLRGNFHVHVSYILLYTFF
jgi:hypothetical protein